MDKASTSMDSVGFSYEPAVIQNGRTSRQTSVSSITSLQFLRQLPKLKLRNMSQMIENGQYNHNHNFTVEDRRNQRTMVLTGKELQTLMKMLDSEEDETPVDYFSEISVDDLESVNAEIVVENPTSNGPIPNVRPFSQPKVTGFVYLAGFMAGIGGFLYGYNMGVVSSAMLFITEEMHLDYKWTQLEISIALAASAFFCIVAGWFAETFGRKLAILVSSALYTIGAILQSVSKEKTDLLEKRVIIGAAIGFATMTVPAYIAEATPANARGLMVTGFQWMITFGFFFANILGGVFSTKFAGFPDFPTQVGWKLLVGLAAVPSFIQFVGFFFMPESPRWLIEKERNTEALNVLRGMYGEGEEAWAQFDYNEIHETKLKDKEERKNLGRGFVLFGFEFLVVLRHMITIRHVRIALIVGCLLQMFQQLSGINTLMYYTGTIMKMAGNQDTNKAIWMSCAVTGCNFISTIIALLFIEKIGRKKLLLFSMSGVIASLLILGVGFLLIHMDSAIPTDSPIPKNYLLNGSLYGDVTRCSNFANCDSCVTIETCGFCYLAGDAQKHAEDRRYGACLPNDLGKSSHSMIGNCIDADKANANSSIIWANNWCISSYSWIPIVGMVCYLFSFSTGLAPIPWVMNAEIYPSWARSTGVALATLTNWLFNLLVSQTFLWLTEIAYKYGAFFIYMGITVFSAILFFFIIPETKGLQIEDIEVLFMSKEERERSLSVHRKETTNTFVIDSALNDSGNFTDSGIT